jgi:hypothetical protein
MRGPFEIHFLRFANTSALIPAHLIAIPASMLLKVSELIFSCAEIAKEFRR